jgi:hypothetical protein
MDLPLALSVHRFVSSVGAYAGFASIIGLAILVLLFFAQARETSALRDHVDELLHRIAGLEARVSRQPQAVAAPATPAAEPVRQTAPALAAVGGSPAQALALPPAPPAGVGAPALSAATRVVPLGMPAGAALAARSGGGVATVSAPAPATPAGATNGSSGPRPAPMPVPAGPASSPPRSAAARPPGGSLPARSALTSSATAGRRAAGRPAPPSREPAASGGGRPVGRLVLIAVAVLAVGAAIAGAIVLISSNSKSPNSRISGASRQSTTPATAATKVDARTVTVAVLNGTSIAGLAHRISQRLVALGFVKGAVTTAADQTRTSTTVAYIPGARTQALAVARALKLGAASVAPVDQGTRTVACEGLSTCTASVMVTVGSDLTNR